MFICNKKSILKREQFQDFFLFLKLCIKKQIKKKKKNSCFINKRTKSFIRFFGVNRISLKEQFYEGKIPGLLKSSW